MTCFSVLNNSCVICNNGFQISLNGLSNICFVNHSKIQVHCLISAKGFSFFSPRIKGTINEINRPCNIVKDFAESGA